MFQVHVLLFRPSGFQLLLFLFCLGLLCGTFSLEALPILLGGLVLLGEAEHFKGAFCGCRLGLLLRSAHAAGKGLHACEDLAYEGAVMRRALGFHQLIGGSDTLLLQLFLQGTVFSFTVPAEEVDLHE